MTGFIPLVMALAGFVAVHAAMSRKGLRDPLAARLGRAGYGAANGIVSLLLMALVFWALRKAPYVELWPPLAILRSVPFVAMPLAGILLVTALGTPGAGLSGDRLPAPGAMAPGILSITRHPLPWALILWAGSHVLANGDLAAFLMFGAFLAFAAAGPIAIDRRRRRLCGDTAWASFAAVTSTLPFAAALSGRTAIDWCGIGWVRPAIAIIAWAALMLAHPWFAGVHILTF